MATFAQLGLIAQESEFQSRVQCAMSVAAVNVYAESTTTLGHNARAVFAVKVLNNQFSLIGACYGVLANPTIAAEATLPASVTMITNGSTVAASNVLKFASGGSSVTPGMIVVDVTGTSVLLSNTLVLSSTATTVTINQNAVGAGVALGDAVSFTSPPAGNSIPDSDIQFAVNSIWNAIAWA